MAFHTKYYNNTELTVQSQARKEPNIRPVHLQITVESFVKFISAIYTIKMSPHIGLPARIIQFLIKIIAINSTDC